MSDVRDEDIRAMQKRHGKFEDSPLAKRIPEIPLRLGPPWDRVVSFSPHSYGAHPPMSRAEVHRRYLAFSATQPMGIDGQDLCVEHFDLGPTVSEMYGHALYVDACGWCAEGSES